MSFDGIILVTMADKYVWRDGVVVYQPGYVAKPEQVFQEILGKVQGLAKSEKGILYGRAYESARRTLQIADENARLYAYSGASAKETYRWDVCPAIQYLRDQLEASHGVRYNFCLVNVYTPDAYLSFHSDDEDDMASDSVASISLGQVRTFKFRPKDKKLHVKKPQQTAERGYWEKKLENGSLLVMSGECQRVLKHGLPPPLVKEKVTGVRINLTFRVMKKQSN